MSARDAFLGRFIRHAVFVVLLLLAFGELSIGFFTLFLVVWLGAITIKDYFSYRWEQAFPPDSVDLTTNE